MFETDRMKYRYIKIMRNESIEGVLSFAEVKILFNSEKQIPHYFNDAEKSELKNLIEQYFTELYFGEIEELPPTIGDHLINWFVYVRDGIFVKFNNIIDINNCMKLTVLFNDMESKTTEEAKTHIRKIRQFAYTA